MDCTFITYRDLPDLDPDDKLALEVLSSRGYKCQAAVWDDPEVDWENAGVCVLRSTWDYHLKLNEFKTWLDSLIANTTVVNHPAYLKWNMHKTYLAELEAAGLPIVPTVILKQNAKNGRAALSDATFSKAIIKPAVGLATSGVMVMTQDNVDAAGAHVEKLLETGDVLLQPFLESVNGYGERSLVFFNGEYSHSARKTAFQALAVAGGAGETFAEDVEEEIAVAKKVAAQLPRLASHTVPPVYCRIDLVRNDRNEPVVLEVELIEPTLFLSLYEPAARAFADAIEAVMAGSTSRTGIHS